MQNGQLRSWIVLDELHKYRKWKNWLKGEYDKHKGSLNFLVTGSAKMDLYRRGGDSLQGRYHHLRLHPFTYAELNQVNHLTEPFEKLTFQQNSNQESFDLLFRYSGFPEPLFTASQRAHRRWQKERIERFFREDVLDLENIRDLSSLQLLADMIPERVSSLLSLNALREDLEVSHRAITSWIDLLERLYYLFRVRPYTTQAIRGLKKEYKAYLWDWTLVADNGKRFENMIASHLLKFCHFLEDAHGYKMELCFIRDVDKREVDFLVTCDHKPWFAVETKQSNETFHKPLDYFATRLKIPYCYQIVMNGSYDVFKKSIRMMPATNFLSGII